MTLHILFLCGKDTHLKQKILWVFPRQRISTSFQKQEPLTAHLIFVIFSLRAKFPAQFFSTINVQCCVLIIIIYDIAIIAIATLAPHFSLLPPTCLFLSFLQASCKLTCKGTNIHFTQLCKLARTEKASGQKSAGPKYVYQFSC